MENDRLELEGLYAGREPRPELAERVVADWRTSMRGVRTPRTTLLRIAAGLILFLLGGAAGRLSSPSPAPEWTGPRFMLLLWEGPDFGAGRAPGSFAPEYAAWARRVASEGVRLSGDELGNVQRVPAGASGAPDAQIGGYFIIEAADTAAARRIAEGHPHTAHGGWIEVAPIIEHPGGR